MTNLPREIVVCENCEVRLATSIFRSIRVCTVCDDLLEKEEQEFRGSKPQGLNESFNESEDY